MSFVKSGYANTFLQEAPTEEYGYLTSTGVGDVTIPKRPRTIKYDPDIRHSGEFKATEFVRGEPGEITAPFSRPLDTVRNHLQELDCPVNARINYACRGDRNIVWNYELGLALLGAEFESGSVGAPVAATPDQNDRVMTGGDLKALGWSYVYLLEGLAATVPGTADICAIAFVPQACGDRCGRRIKLGCEGLAARCASPYYYTDQILKTIDCSTTWAATGNDPFGGDRDVTDFIIVETATGIRIIAAGEGVAGEYAQISYLDVTYQTDYDDAWVDVTVGAVAAQGINGLVVAPNGYIWAAADDGYIYRSRDLGMSWTAMHSGTIVATDLRDLVFVTASLGFVVGNNNVVLGTTNGGDSWAAYTGPAAAGVALTSIAVNRDGYLFVTANSSIAVPNARMYRSIDNSNSWEQILELADSNTMPRVRFDEDLLYFGYAIYDNDDGVGTLLRSEDGGVSWLAWDTPTNTGLHDLWICDPNMVYVCGNAAFIAKFDRAAT